MFLHILTDTQQRAFLVLAREFIEADQYLAAEEQNLLELMWAETGQPFGPELAEGDRATLLAAFDTRQAQAAVLLELIGVGHADSEFHAQESQFIHDAAAKFGVPAERVRAMENWVERQLALARDVEQFWAE